MAKILVIEDNTDVRENLCEILNLSGHETIEAENGKVGVEKASNVLPDLIICDVMMPYLDGFGVLKILNQNPRTQHIPFLFLTAKADKTDFRRGMGLGADDYITKPFDDIELLEAIETRLKKNKERGQAYSLSSSAVFGSRENAEKEIINYLKDAEIRSFEAKQHIFQEGQNINNVYFILEGSVRLYKTNEFGKEFSYAIQGPKEFIDLSSSLSSTYTNNAISLDNVKVGLIPMKDFNKSMLGNKMVADYLMNILAQEVKNLQNNVIEMAYSSVRRKVALAICASLDEDDNIHLSREELASLAGVAKETLIRTLSDFKNEDLIEIINHHIHVNDIEEIRHLPQ